ncbi:MAG: EAL domain-containing protein [Pseudomonadota bacterium]
MFSRIACRHACDGLVVMNIDGKIQWANPAYCALMGYDLSAIVGRHPLTFAPLPEEHQTEAELVDYRLDDDPALLNKREIRRNTRKDGTIFWNEITMSLHTAPDGQSCAVLVCRDVSEIVERENELAQTSQKLAHIAAHDALTGVANRAELSRFLDTALKSARKYRTEIGIFHVDLDEFKHINDTFGHSAGDAVLKATAERLAGCLRKTDLVARVGGDEFIVVCDAIATLDALKRIGEKLLCAANNPVPHQNGAINCQISVGAALSDKNICDVETLMNQSDFALYEVKRKERGGLAIYNAELHERHMRGIMLENALVQAIEDKALSFHFQPVVGTPPGVVRGLETLVRWYHPTEGLITPDELIPMAQKLGLVAELDMLAMNVALDMKAKLNEWGHHDVITSFNASADVLKHPDFFEKLISGLLFRDLTTDEIIVEVLEDVVFEADGETNPLVQILADLAEAGIFVVLDDFGSGNAGIAQLARLAIKGVKFDKSIGMNILTDPTMSTIYQTLTGLCDDLDLRTVTEGVETPEDAARLCELGCTNIQGFLIAKPMPPEEVRAWVDAYTGSAIAHDEPHRYLKAN